MEINIPTGQDILRDIAIKYVNKAFVYITDCNPPLMKAIAFYVRNLKKFTEGNPQNGKKNGKNVFH